MSNVGRLKLGYCDKCKKIFKRELLKEVVFVDIETINLVSSSFTTYDRYKGAFLCQQCYDEVNKQSNIEETTQTKHKLHLAQ